MKPSRTIVVSAAVAEMHRQINPGTPSPSQEHLFDFAVAEINFFLAAEGKMLKIEGGVREVDPRWSLLLGSPPVTGYVMADLNQRETRLYLRGFLTGIKEERNVADATLQTMTDKFTALLKKGNKSS